MGLVWAPKYFDFEREIELVKSEKGLNGLTYEKGPANIKGLPKPTHFKENEFTFAF